MWILMIVPKPDEQCGVEAVKGVPGSEVDAAPPALEPRLKGTPIGGAIDDGPNEWKVGDIIVFLPGERLRVGKGGTFALTNVHITQGG